MKYYLMIIFLLLAAGMAYGQVDFAWAQQAGGMLYDRAYGIAVDAAGNSYVVGYFYGTAAFGATNLVSAGESDIFIAKLDGYGNFLWAQQAGGTLSDQGFGIAVDGAGNAYVTGYFEGTAAFGATNLVSAEYMDIFVAKLDGDGNFLWAEQAGGTTYDFGRAVAVDAAGNAYVTGSFGGTATFGATTLIFAGGSDVFVTKLDGDGSFLWAKQAGGASYDSPRGIAVDAAGNSHVTGYFFGTATFGTTTLVCPGLQNMFITKLDGDGNFLWAKQAGGAGAVEATGIAVDAAGNSYATGYFYGTAAFGTTNLVSAGGEDVFIARFDGDGNLIWAQQAGGTSPDFANGIAVDLAGNAYATGNFSGTATFGATSLVCLGDYDVFITKLDGDGNYLWTQQAGGTLYDNAYGIAVNAAVNCYIAGAFNGAASFGTTTLVSAGGVDIFVASIRPDSDLRAAAGSHRTICQGEQTVLGAYPPAHGGLPPYQYAWTSDPAGFTASLPHPTVSPACDTAYTLTVTDAYMTAAQSTVWVYVANYLATPLLLSPPDSSTLPDLDVLLTWSDVADETGYTLHINDDQGHFWHIDIPADQAACLIDESAGILSRGRSYTWYVEALSDGSLCNSQQQDSFTFAIEGLPEPVTQSLIYAAKGLHKDGLGACRTNLGLTSLDSACQTATLALRNANGRLLDTVDLVVGYNTFAGYADILERFPGAYLEGTIDIQSPDRVYLIGGLVDNVSNDPSMYPKESEAGTHIFTPLVLRTADWRSQVMLRNLSGNDLTVQLTSYMPGGVASAQRTIHLAAGGYFKTDDIMQYLSDPQPYVLLTAQVTQGTGEISGAVRQLSTSHTGGIYPFYQVDSGVHEALLPYLCDTADYRGSMGLCNTTDQPISITASLVSNGSVIDQQTYAVAPMSYLAVADAASRFSAGKRYSGVEGCMRLTSAQTFHAIGGIINRQTSDPSVYGMQQPFASAFTPLVIRDSVWQTRLVLANDTQAPIAVDLTLYSDGQPQGAVPVTVPGMSVLRLDDVLALFHSQADYGTLFLDAAAPVCGIVLQCTSQGTGGVYPLFSLD